MNNYTTQKRAFWYALLYSAVFFVIAYLLGFCWETNDDPSIAYLISRQTNNYSPFQWRLLSRVLHRMYMRFPVVDWWAVCTVFACWVSAFVYTYVTYRRYPSGLAFLISTVLLILLWLIACYKANFTRTAAVVAIAGIFLIANSIFPARPSRFLLLEYIFGCFLLLFGASIRGNCARFALAFLATIGLVKLLSDKFSFKWQWIRSHLRQMLLLCLSAALFFASSALNKAQLTTSQNEFLEYNKFRSAIIDYGSNYPDFHEASEAYLEAGWNQIGTEVFFNWLSEDTDVFTVESMEQVGELYEHAHAFDKLPNLIKTNPEITYFAIFAVLLLCCYKKRNWIYGVTSFSMFALLCVYLVIEGRFPSRVYQSLMLGAVCTAVFLCNGEQLSSHVPAEPYGPAVNLLYMKQVVTVLVSVGFVLNLFAGTAAVKDYYTATKEARSMTEQRTAAAADRALLDAIDADQEHLYMFDILTAPASISSAFSFFDMPPMEYCENRFSLGGWTARSPYRIAQLASYGITNPVKALFERTDVYSTYSSRLLKFLHAYYDPHITASGTKMIGGAQFVQYTKPIEESLVISDPAKRVVISEFYRSDPDEEGTCYLSATISDSADQERVFYCNIEADGNSYTYRLSCEGNLLSGILYDVDSTCSLDPAQIRIFEKIENAYIEYSMNASTIDLLPYLTNVYDCQASETKNGILLSDTGTDAQLFFSVPELDGLSVMGISVEMEAQTSSMAQAFVATQRDEYREEQSRTIQYESGNVSYFLESPAGQPVSLRFDPTTVEGQTLLLQSLRLVLFSAE